jgi:inorganic pyrophosphatase
VRFDAEVEVPTGSRNKYEVDHKTGRIKLDRTLFTATAYPCDYGFIPDTLAEDDDPLDVLVLVEQPTFPGCVIAVRPVAVFWMRDEKGPDAKILCVPADNPRQDHIRDKDSVASHLLDEIGHFFQVYKDLEPGKSTDVRGWEGRQAAERVVEEARQRWLHGRGT